MVRYVAALLLGLVSWLVPSIAQAMPSPEFTWFERGIHMEPRFQWNANDGYCGEVSFISAGMFYGQYASQWTARDLVSPGTPQWKTKSQLLLGVNDMRAARAMRLDAVAFPSSRQQSTPQFLRWVKHRFIQGQVVIIGVFNNVYMLNEPASLADASYDHIVPVMGIGSARSFAGSADRYYPTDDIVISDNGLHSVGPNVPYLYQYKMRDFMATRAEANATGGPLYSLRDRPSNYAAAVLGVADPDGVTIPVRLTSDSNTEGVQDQPYLRKPPAPIPITLTAQVRVPDPDQAYAVYLYDDFDDVPIRDFNRHADRAVQSWTIPAGHVGGWSVRIGALSSDTRVFRAVAVSAP